MNLRHSLLLVTAAFGAGLFFTLWQRDALPTLPTLAPTPPVQAETTLPTEVAPDLFTHKLLQAALQSSEGNILLTPRALATNLQTLCRYSGGATREEIQALGISPPESAPTETPGEAALLFADYNVPLKEETDANDIIPIPLSEDVGKSIPLINNIVAQATGTDQLNLLNGDHLAAAPRLISTVSLELRPHWVLPMYASPSADSDFFNANGSMPRIRTISCRGDIRIAQAPGREWLAFALFLHENPDECLLVILPQQSSARAFAQSMDAKLLADIRLVLAQAESQPGVISMPRLHFSLPTQDILPLLRQMGLAHLTSPKADLSAITAESPFYLQAALQKCHLSLIESPHASPGDSAPTISVNKPFIWFLGSLTAPTPPHAFGIIENL